MKIRNLAGLFDEQQVMEKLSKLGDPLVLIALHTDFDIYRPMLNALFGRDEKKSKVGRPAYDVVVMLKIIFLQRFYNLSDEQTEFQISDRLSFRRFLGIPFSDSVPDAKTLWAFREALKKGDQGEKIFRRSLAFLSEQGLIAREGKIVDATVISVPVQRNKKAENEQIKQGKVPENFTDNKHKGSQKDTDARWGAKGRDQFFGYKNHVKVDAKSKLITDYEVTDASVHDSQPAPDLISKSEAGEPFFGDSAYRTPKILRKIKNAQMKVRVLYKAKRNKPLREDEKQTNHKRSQVRCRVEHVFGFITNSMNEGTYINTIGKARTKVMVGLINWTYNLCRFVQLKKIEIALG